MRAVDTNIIVRYLTGDEPEQASRARSAIDAGDVFAATAVLLESECVLRGVYGFSAGEVAAALRAFAGLPGVSVENPARLAEALHLGAAARCEALLTFDRRFIDLAGDSPVRVMEPPTGSVADGWIGL